MIENLETKIITFIPTTFRSTVFKKDVETFVRKETFNTWSSLDW